MANKKILMVTTIPNTLRGFLAPFAAYFRKQNWQVDAMANDVSSCDDCKANFDHVWDVKWSRNPLDPKNFLLATPKIQQIVSREKYDIVHVHTPVAAFVTRYALSGMKKEIKPKIIYTAHGFHFHSGGKALKNAIFLSLEKLAGRWTDYLVVINREDERSAKQHKIVNPDKVFYMPGIGVDLEYYNSEKVPQAKIELFRQELGLTPETSLFMVLAELSNRKRNQDIIRALAMLERSEVHLALAGEGPLQAKLEQLAVELGVRDRVHFLGIRQDVPVLLRASVAIILASQQEGLPRSIMESMCLETPAIGTKIRGIQELLADGCGLLFEVGDIDELAKAMAWLLDNPDKAHLIAQRAKKNIETYDIKRILTLHKDLYFEALNEFGG